MKDIISKVCSQLITDSHVIGIVLNCGESSEFGELDNMVWNDPLQNEGLILDLCVISKEIGGQRTLYTDAGVRISMRWWKEEKFREHLQNVNIALDEKKVIYDKTGMLKEYFGEELYL